jgi:hypothetical protein
MVMAGEANGKILDADVWRDFCNRLAAAGDVIMRPEVPASVVDRAEGFRYLTRLLRIGLVQSLEAANPDFPFFYRPGDEYTKYGGDNPDNVYWSAMVRGDRDYRITATRGTIYYFSIGSKAFRMEKDGSIESTGELTGSDLKIGPDGKYEILVSSKPQPGNWLPMTTNTNFLLIRQTYLDRKTEIPGTFKIERIGGETAPAPLDPAFLETALRRTADFVHGNAARFLDFLLPFATEKNTMIARDQDYFFKAGGDPLITYLYGFFDLAPDEAWVIDITPPKNIFWNCSLYNWWNESFDYEHRPVTINNNTGKRNPDGSLTVVVAAKDMGVGNWLDTAGHRQGFALFRWYAADGNPQPTTKVVKLT